MRSISTIESTAALFPPWSGNPRPSLSGELLTSQEDSTRDTQNFGSFLVEVVTKDQTLWVFTVALDAIFDVFADDHLDLLSWRSGSQTNSRPYGTTANS
ncbi:HEAT repeat-containing protein 3-like [Lingula anatina]|uniref:HEAT repeat-containing protein 3-like n=1 Tax=Lingula anatina TaxID=7574 RepID=A0A1S3JS64_LINAN|nr:HEAT repeat-containing protein 3-like [Lingula anatina]|eukprot:XP_013413215.1 HEAT repeat-containing protein 3-like [Lingula anatina]